MSSIINCILCDKICKSSDSRPHPNPKSKHRIHNKCLIKKNLAEKNKSAKSLSRPKSNEFDSASSSKTASIVNKITEDELALKRAVGERLISKLEEDRSNPSTNKTDNSGQFFFDLKAGIVKPHEKQRYLNHRNVCEIAARYDDNGFQEETVGRAYDHSGKDLNTLGDSDEEGNQDSRQDKVRDEWQLKLDLIEAQVRNNDHRKHERDRKRHKYESNSEVRKYSRIHLDDKNPCWFCLSSPKVEKHLIVAIGEHCYLTLAKGGLVDEHFLIIPIEHIPDLNDKSNNEDLYQELDSFKKSLVRYFGSKSKGVVFYERNFRSVHWQLQVVPIPFDIIDELEENIKTISTRHFGNANYLDIPAKCSIGDMIPPGAAYLFWHLEPLGIRFVTEIQVKGSFFPVQIGRITLADTKILDCQDRVDWRTCCKSDDEYKSLVVKVKEAYRDYDIT